MMITLPITQVSLKESIRVNFEKFSEDGLRRKEEERTDAFCSQNEGHERKKREREARRLDNERKSKKHNVNELLKWSA